MVNSPSRSGVSAIASASAAALLWACSSSVCARITPNSSPPRRPTMSLDRMLSRSTVGDVAQRRVAGGVAMRVVDLLHVVDVEIDDARRHAIAVGEGDHAGQLAHKGAPVGDRRSAHLRRRAARARRSGPRALPSSSRRRSRSAASRATASRSSGLSASSEMPGQRPSPVRSSARAASRARRRRCSSAPAAAGFEPRLGMSSDVLARAARWPFPR